MKPSNWRPNLRAWATVDAGRFRFGPAPVAAESKALPPHLHRSNPHRFRPLQVPARYKGASGGRASGKSHFFAEEAVAAMVANASLRVVCIREVQRSLKFSAKALVESKVATLGVGSLFDVRASEIHRLDGSGVMIFEGMQDHTAESIKSLEGFGVAWVEEAQTISDRSLQMLLPTIRVEGSEIWFSWNPDQPTDPVDAFFASKPAGSVRVHTTYLDNPFCPAVMHAEADRLLAVDPDGHEHIWGGGYFLGGKGRVYHGFKNKPWPEGNVDESVQDTGGELLVGMDFNVEPMTATVAVRVVNECHVIDAIEIEVGNTPAMALELKRRYPNRRIVVCPDPSGKQRRTSAVVGQTDFTILQQHGFTIRAPEAAPPVVDRENNANAMYFDVFTSKRRVKLHPQAAPLITALANLTYKDGRRDKKSRFDHICFAAGTMILTPCGERRIEDIRAGDLVMTRYGAFPVRAARITSPEAQIFGVRLDNGRRLIATPDHPFWTAERGFLPLRELTPSATLYSCQKLNASSLMASCFGAIRSRRTETPGSTSRRLQRTERPALGDCTKRSGRLLTAQSLAGITSTTETATRSITRWTTSKPSQRRGTWLTTAPNPSGSRAAERQGSLSESGIWLLNGTDPTLGVRGIASTESEHGRGARLSTSLVHGAESQPACASSAVSGISVQTPARRRSATPQGSTTSTASAHRASEPFGSTDTERPLRVRGVAAHISAVRPAGSAPVYNLTVDGPHEYFAEGVLVSNCDAMDYLLWQEFPALTVKPVWGSSQQSLYKANR